MSEYNAAAIREKRKDMARRRAAGEGPGKVDASSYEPPEGMNANIKTGMRPVSKQMFGGDVEGSKGSTRADRKPRKSGGVVTDFMNRNEKDANEERPGGDKQRGGYASGGVPTQRFGFEPAQSRLSKAAGLKAGGMVERDGHKVRVGNRRPKKALGGVLEAVSPIAAAGPEFLSPALMAVKAIKGNKDREERKAGGSVSDGTLQGMRPQGGREARKSGGKAGKTNINIIIGQPQQPEPMAGPPPMPPAPPMMPPKPPMPPPGGPPIGAPPPGMPPMGRKRGGRTYDAGAGGGLGRLEKLSRYGDNARDGEEN